MAARCSRELIAELAPHAADRAPRRRRAARRRQPVPRRADRPRARRRRASPIRTTPSAAGSIASARDERARRRDRLARRRRARRSSSCARSPSCRRCSSSPRCAASRTAASCARRRRASGDSVYVFYHQRLRDAAAAALDRARHAHALHRRYAELFERERGDAGSARVSLGRGRRTPRAPRARRSPPPTPRAPSSRGRSPPTGTAARWSSAADVARPAREARRGAVPRRQARARPRPSSRRSPRETGDRRSLARARRRVVHQARRARARPRRSSTACSRGAASRARAAARASACARALGVAARWLVPRRCAARAHRPTRSLTAAYRVIASFLSTPYPIESFEYVLRGIAIAERAGDRAAHGDGHGDARRVSRGRLARPVRRSRDRDARSGSRSRAARRIRAWSPPARPASSRRCAATGAGCAIAHEEGQQICTRLGLERSWEASFLRTYWALGEFYAGEPRARSRCSASSPTRATT